MLGSMMMRPLKVADILTFAADTHPTGEIVSVRTEGDLHRYTYADSARRAVAISCSLRSASSCVVPGCKRM